jgi:ankyrin repeat protein
MQRSLEIAQNMRTDKARNNFLAFLSTMEQLTSAEDDTAFENTPADIRNDDSDGVACRLETDLIAIQQSNLRTLQNNFGEFFPEEVEVIQPELASESDGINKAGKWGYTQLHFAVVNQDLAMVQSLLEQGARTDILDHSDHTALDKAERCLENNADSREIVRLLGGKAK